MDDFGFVLATRMLVEGGHKVRYMYREEAITNPIDSGWRFFCGDEDDEYVNDPDNIAVYDIDSILEIDGSVLPYLGCSAGVAFEREDENGTFIVSDGFSAGGKHV